HESLVTYGRNVAPEVITCSHEEVAVAMAEGYYLATGRPQATLVHNIVGLQHASKAIYEAWLNNVPMLIIGGTGPLDSTLRGPHPQALVTPPIYITFDCVYVGERGMAPTRCGMGVAHSSRLRAETIGATGGPLRAARDRIWSPVFAESRRQL